MVNHDRLFKELLTTFFYEFVELFLPEVAEQLDKSSITFMDKEIFTDVTSGDTHIVDLVVRAKLKNCDTFFIIHTELQASVRKDLPARLFHYFGRLYAKYALPVIPVVLYSHDYPFKEEPSVYEISILNYKPVRFQYVVIQLNNLKWKTFLSKPNPVAAALMSKMLFAPEERIHVKLECLHMLAKLKLDRARIRLISGFIDTYLRLNKEELKKFEVEIKAMAKQEQEEVMEIVTSWMEDGIQQGLKQGLEQGLEQGSHKTAESLVLRQLTRRLGRISKPVEKRIKSLSLEQLERLSEDLLDFTTIGDLRSWLADS